ncbi:MAG: aminodeoxychorismate synthase component I [Paludibacteraceae bacterium]|nr:aminodeoxychorismate synthase component I [Paludibacteraceae bacterium]
MLNRIEAIREMNRYGDEKRPFFFMVDFLQENSLVIPLKQIATSEIQFAIPGFSAQHEYMPATEGIYVKHRGYSQSIYTSQIQNVIQNIKQGNSFLVNLTCQTAIDLNASLEDVYFHSEAKYKLWYKNKFVVFSPETFVRIHNGYISSYPMKGTIDASVPHAREVILNNPKERAEHYTIVDLIRNDLSMVAEEVMVKRFRYIDEINTDRGTLLQVSSEIEGTLPIDYNKNIGDILFTLLPAGSITGAPKNKTVEIIRSTETYERGFYTGVFGVFDGCNMDSAVMIRFIEHTPEGYVYKSGGGITAFSQEKDEYNELLEKIYVPVSRKY